MDCSVTAFVDEVLNSFNIFCHFSGDGHPGCFSFLTDIQAAFKRECHSKTAF
jgi:hypothetical protein